MEEQGGGVWTGYFFSCAVLSQGKQGFPLLRRHRLWSKARDGMISVAFAFQIHQSSDKETHSIQVLKYFFLFDTESSQHCRNQLSSRSNSSALSSLSPAPLLHPLDVHFCKFSLQNKPIIFHHRIFTASISAKFNWLLISSLEVIDADIICTVVNYGAIKLWLFHCNFLCQLI